MSEPRKVTIDGVELEASEEKWDDIEIVEMMEKTNDNPIYTPSLIKALFGEDKYQEIKKALADEKTGKTKTSDVGKFLTKAFNKFNALKN